jgi:hypothetical protein
LCALALAVRVLRQGLLGTFRVWLPPGHFHRR